ncbi:TPA: DUF4752 family protein [Klebsiella oxytoca]
MYTGGWDDRSHKNYATDYCLHRHAYIFFKAGEWIISIAAKQWCKRRKESLKQKAVNDLYDAFELSKINPGDTVKITTKGNLRIMMYRESKED